MELVERKGGKRKRKSRGRTDGKVDQSADCLFWGWGVAPKFFGPEPPLHVAHKFVSLIISFSENISNVFFTLFHFFAGHKPAYNRFGKHR